MSRRPKYTITHLSLQVRVMSTRDYWLTVRLRGLARAKEFDLRYREFYRWTNAPKYLINEVMERARDAYAKEQLVFYEHDQDGNRRTENLRYFDAEEVARLLNEP